jgi:hypothetical protein
LENVLSEPAEDFWIPNGYQTYLFGYVFSQGRQHRVNFEKKPQEIFFKYQLVA